MDHVLPPEIQLLRDTVRAFADREVRPLVDDMEAAGVIPQALVDRMSEVGIFGAPFPAEYGGAGLGELAFAVVQEELSRTHASTGLLVAASSGLAARLL
jgi:alkylation response protein AidB-like acyl-CoA dehydrogenase